MKTLTTVAIQNNKKNKTRSILIIIAIVLTTILLTIIANYCYGIIKNNREHAGDYYGVYHGMYRSISQEQIEQMELRSEFSKIGRMAYAGEIESERNMALYWVDTVTMQMMNMENLLEKGTMPEKTDEIIANRSFFEQLGIENPQVGDEVTLYSRIDNKSKFSKNKFKISGIIQEQNTQLEQKSYIGYVSQKFYNDQTEEDTRYYNVYFQLNDAVKINYDNAEQFIQELGKKCGIDEKQTIINSYYIMWSTDPGIETIVGGSILILGVVVFSSVVIYNIFQVGIVQKIQEYGKIKALGATKKQLKKIVQTEGIILAFIGVPIGLLLGCIIGNLTFAWIMEQAKMVDSKLEGTTNIVSIPILFIVIIIAFITVRLALEKPMRMVAKASPVEAIRFEGNKNQSVRKGHRHVSVKEMTMANISANKKRTVGTILTMGLSCVLFVVIANFVGNMDAEYSARQNIEYGQIMIDLDYSLSDEAYPENNLDSILKEDPLGEDTIQQIETIEGVTDIRVRKQLAMKTMNEEGKPSDEIFSVMVLNREDFEKYRKDSGIVGDFTYDTVAEENGIIYGYSYFMEDHDYFIGQNLDMRLENGASSCDYNGTIQGAFGNVGSEWVITEETYKQLGLKEGGNGQIWVDCKEEDVESVKEQLEDILLVKDHVEINTYADELQASQLSMKMMRLMCYVLVMIVGLIGFINMANTMIISIITRRREFGMLQAIGMTNSQLNQMLQTEGFLFTIGTVFVSMLIGVPIGYGLFQYGKEHSWMGLYQYHLPWMEIIGMVIVIGILQTILSFILSRNIRKESVISRIQY